VRDCAPGEQRFWINLQSRYDLEMEKLWATAGICSLTAAHAQLPAQFCPAVG
jgi:plasmid maintenance system antidote protein VapI